MSQAVQDRQRERGRLPGSGLGTAQHVTLLERGGDRLCLNGGRGYVIFICDCALHRRNQSSSSNVFNGLPRIVVTKASTSRLRPPSSRFIDNGIPGRPGCPVSGSRSSRVFISRYGRTTTAWLTIRPRSISALAKKWCAGAGETVHQLFAESLGSRLDRLHSTSKRRYWGNSGQTSKFTEFNASTTTLAAFQSGQHNRWLAAKCTARVPTLGHGTARASNSAEKCPWGRNTIFIKTKNATRLLPTASPGFYDKTPRALRLSIGAATFAAKAQSPESPHSECLSSIALEARIRRNDGGNWHTESLPERFLPSRTRATRILCRTCSSSTLNSGSIV